MQAGTVTVFNNYNEPMNTLTVNGTNVGDIPAWAGTGSEGAVQFTPKGKAVPRVGRSEDATGGKFATGSNQITVRWDSFVGKLTVTVPGPGDKVSLDDNLILYITANQAFLMNTRGFVIAEPIQVTTRDLLMADAEQ